MAERKGVLPLEGKTVKAEAYGHSHPSSFIQFHPMNASRATSPSFGI